MYKHLTLALCLTLLSTSPYAQITPDQWSADEQRWVKETRAMYEQQGLEFSDQQAGDAIQKIRDKKQTTSAGIPKSQWTPTEQQAIAGLTAQYAKQGTVFSDEQAELAVKSMRNSIAKMSGQFAVIQALANGSIPAPNMPALPTPATPPSSNSMTEQEMAQRISAFTPISGPLKITGRRDGFSVNGQAYLDSEGPIVNYAYDVLTGDISYMAQIGHTYMIKSLRAGERNEAIQIATAQKNATGAWEVSTTTGKRLTGSTLSMSPLGLLVSRESSAFRYEPGKGVQNIAVPDGYSIASLQHGNIGATGFVLLEKDAPDDKGLAGLTSAFQSIGATLGVAKKADYALMNINNGKLFPLDITLEGKNVSKLSDCRKRNNYINVCNNSISFESIYEPDGGRNIRHYYWKTNWFNTPSGPIAVTMENGLKDIFVTDLTSGKKVLAFNRMLGIGSMVAEQLSDGVIKIKANMGFSSEEIADAAAHLKNGVDVGIKVAN